MSEIGELDQPQRSSGLMLCSSCSKVVNSENVGRGTSLTTTAPLAEIFEAASFISRFCHEVRISSVIEISRRDPPYRLFSKLLDGLNDERGRCPCIIIDQAH